MWIKRLVISVLVVVALIAGYFAIVLNWSYSSGERAGWVQKLSKKGWVCKTWEGELALVSMPGAAVEKFLFTVTDDAVAEKINRVLGKRVALHYEEKVGLPTTCFGETRHFVTGVTVVDEISISPGVVVQPSPTPSAAQPLQRLDVKRMVQKRSFLLEFSRFGRLFGGPMMGRIRVKWRSSTHGQVAQRRMPRTYAPARVLAHAGSARARYPRLGGRGHV